MDIVLLNARKDTYEPVSIGVGINLPELTLEQAIQLRNSLTANINEFVRRKKVITPDEQKAAEKGDA